MSVSSYTKASEKRKLKTWLENYSEAAAALLCGLFAFAAWMSENMAANMSVALYVLSFLIGGFVKAKEGLLTLLNERDIDVNLLMIVAAVGAASIGYWAEGAVLIFIFALSGALESYTMARSKREISSLMDMKPETAVLFQDGRERIVAVEQLKPGDVIIVKPGERIPADGRIAAGSSAVDQAAITGESVPADKSAGDEVFAGTLNGQGALVVEVTQPGESTLFAKIIQMVHEAQSEKPASQRFVERFERIYARLIIAAALLLGSVPVLLGMMAWKEALYKTMVFLVVASPCAVVASIMPAVLSAISKGARKGLLFKGGAHLENLSQVRVVAFDKTGTLTAGRPDVTDMIPFQGLNEQELLRIAASVESLSEHPLAKAIVRKAEEEGINYDRPAELRSLSGFGVEAVVKGERWYIGKPASAEEQPLAPEVQAELSRLQEQGKTVAVVYHSRGAAGIIAFRDRLRAEAIAAIAQLKRQGILVAMLTGDQRRTAQAIAAEAGIDIVYAELLPQEKAERIKELKQKYGAVAMVGDGINDAPALATATVGIGMGATGSDAALETADLVLMNDDIAKIPEAVALGQKTGRVVKQNLGFAVAVIILLIAVNFIEGIALPLGVVGHEGSTLLVILNGLRLLR
jgi:Cd2+/Zn2+-exporting ATPase